MSDLKDRFCVSNLLVLKIAGLNFYEEFMTKDVDVETVHFDLKAVIRLSVPVLQFGVKAPFAQCADQMFAIRICLISSIFLYYSLFK